MGETDCHKDIWIDLKAIGNQNPLKIYLHETMHIRHPDWGERRIRKATDLRWRRMTAYEMFELGHKLFRMWREEE